jgi:hypothetical protein
MLRDKTAKKSPRESAEPLKCLPKMMNLWDTLIEMVKRKDIAKKT